MASALSDQEKSETFTRVLSCIIGEQLSAVTFVQDYLQLHFDGPLMNVTTKLTVSSEATVVTSWEPGFRDSVCGQLGKIVAHARAVLEEDVLINFADGSFLSASLRLGDYEIEAVYFSSSDNREWFAV